MEAFLGSIISGLIVVAVGFGAKRMGGILMQVARQNDAPLSRVTPAQRDLFVIVVAPLVVILFAGLPFLLGTGIHFGLNRFSRWWFARAEGPTHKGYPFDALWQIGWPWWVIGSLAAVVAIVYVVGAIVLAAATDLFLPTVEPEAD